MSKYLTIYAPSGGRAIPFPDKFDSAVLSVIAQLEPESIITPLTWGDDVPLEDSVDDVIMSIPMSEGSWDTYSYLRSEDAYEDALNRMNMGENVVAIAFDSTGEEACARLRDMGHDTYKLFWDEENEIVGLDLVAAGTYC